MPNTRNMDAVTLLLKQTGDAYNWVEKLLSSVPYTQWDVMPDVMETSLSWQTGHLVLSCYFHSVMVIAGHQPEILKTIPLKEYDRYFTIGHPSDSKGIFDPATLHSHLRFAASRSLDVIAALQQEDLQKTLEPTSTRHPVADTKLEALDWNIKHTMWHCGQIAMLKRMVNERFDFGLKRDM